MNGPQRAWATESNGRVRIVVVLEILNGSKDSKGKDKDMAYS